MIQENYDKRENVLETHESKHSKVLVEGRERYHPVQTWYSPTHRQKKEVIDAEIYIPALGLVGREFVNGPGGLGSIQDRVIPKTLKMVHGASLLNTQ